MFNVVTVTINFLLLKMQKKKKKTIGRLADEANKGKLEYWSSESCFL